MNEAGKRRIWLLVASTVLAAGTFILDLSLELGIAVGVPYVLVVLLSLWLPRRRDTIIAAVSCTILTILGFFLSPAGGEPWNMHFNHALMAIFAIWVTAILLLGRQRAEEALRQAEARYHDLYDNAPDMMAAVDMTSGEILECNQTFADVLGHRKEEIIGRSFLELYHPESREVAQKTFAQFARTGKIVEEERTFVRADGTTIDVLLRATPIRDENGKVVASRSIWRDITARKQVEAEARRLQEEALAARAEAEAARQADELKNEFLSIVSHELRTPLTSLLGFAELLLYRQLPPARQRRFLQMIYEESQRLKALIDDFLDLQRLESGRVTYDFQPVALTPLVAEVVELFAGQSTAHQLVTGIPATLPPVQADAERLRLVLSNLVSNAIKYSPNGGEVQVAACQESDMVRISVRDQGLGIPVGTEDQLFEKFYRVPSAERETIRGTGLGLAIVKEVVEAHSGRVWAESPGPGRGATFHFTLPVA